MDVLKLIEQKKLAVVVLDIGDMKMEDTVTPHDVARRQLLDQAELGVKMQWFAEHCLHDYGFITDGICPADRDCAKCWATLFQLMPNRYGEVE